MAEERPESDVHRQAEEIARRLFGQDEGADTNEGETRQTIRLSLSTGMAVGQWRHAIAALIASALSSQQMMERILAATEEREDKRYEGLRRVIESDLSAIREVVEVIKRRYPNIGDRI